MSHIIYIEEIVSVKEENNLNIIIQYPPKKAVEELQISVAMVHCNAILNYIGKLSCPLQQKKYYITNNSKMMTQQPWYMHLSMLHGYLLFAYQR